MLISPAHGTNSSFSARFVRNIVGKIVIALLTGIGKVKFAYEPSGPSGSVLWSGLVLREGASHRDNLIAPFPLRQNCPRKITTNYKNYYKL